MKVSVITACYNSEATIQKAIDSVAGQTWPSIEHIVIDGSSKDATVEVVNRNLSRIAYFVSEPDSGVYQAMNKGLERATGDVIAFLNSDDVYINSQAIKSAVTVLEEENLDAVYGNVEFFHPSKPDKVVRTYDSGRFNPDRMGWGWMPAHPALFIRRQVYEQSGYFKEDYQIAGDYEFIVRAFKAGKLKSRHIPEVLVRMQTGGLSTAGLSATFQLNKEMLRACRQNGISSNWLMLLSKYFYKVREVVPF
jgi:glycosyltransferase involved in cell wall biosynthesis